MWESDSDEDDALDFSPPKTMQFHVPQSRLLQTPGKLSLMPFCLPVATNEFVAREASKRIVEDLLLTAGGDITDEFEGEEDSPSVVRRNQELDDSF